MKVSRPLLISLFALALSLNTFAGDRKLKAADKLYDDMAYARAIELYESIAKEGNTHHVTKRLANCYRLINNSVKAELWYGNLIELGNKYPEDYYYYAQALAENGKYEQSNFWMDEFRELNVKDSRGFAHYNAMARIADLKKDTLRFTIDNLESNCNKADFAPAFMENEIVFVSARGINAFIKRSHAWDDKSFLDLYAAEISEQGDFYNPTKLKGAINSNLHEGPAAYISGSETLIFTRNNIHNGKKNKSKEGVSTLKMFFCKKDINGEWNNISPFPYNNDEYSVGHPTVSADGKRIYFVSDMPGSMGNSDIWFSNLQADSTWGEPVNLGPEINTEGNEMFPFIHDNKNLYFASDGHLGLGGLDVFMIEIKDLGWGMLHNLGASINGPSDDFGFILDPTENYGYFSSNREGGEGDDDIYSLKMSIPFEESLTVKGLISEAGAEAIPIAGAIVALEDENGTIITQTIADENGNYHLNVMPGKDLFLRSSNTDYKTRIKKVPLTSSPQERDEIIANLILPKSTEYTLVAKIVDNQNKNIITDARVRVIDTFLGSEIQVMESGYDGIFITELPQAEEGKPLSYEIRIEKSGFLTKVITLTQTPGENRTLYLEQDGQIVLIKADVGDNLANLIDMNPVHFDLNKASIRDDAAVELDRIVKVMKENPNMEVELRSHADSRGTADYNTILSDKRSKSSAAYILSNGIEKTRINSEGLGESQLLNRCADSVECSEGEHQENRRTEVMIIKL